LIVIYAFLPMIVFVMGTVKVKVRVVGVLGFMAFGFFVLNAYIRSKGTYVAADFSNIFFVFIYALLQPVIYASETFGNLSTVVGSTSLLGSNGSAMATIPEFKIVPSFGILAARFGGAYATFIMFITFMSLWLLYKNITKPMVMMVYCVVSP